MLSASVRVGSDEPRSQRPPVPTTEAGTEAQLRQFFHKYLNHERLSSKCYLDGRYFWRVLSPYAGLIPSEMYIRINQEASVPANQVLSNYPLDLKDKRTASVNLEDLQLQPFEISLTFAGDDLARTKGLAVRYRLIKLIIDIADNPEVVRGTIHSNLIYIDTKKKTVKRFEPLFNAPYTHVIDRQLKAFFNEYLPDYHYTMSPEHPQKPISDRCPSRGMCAAFVLKKAMLLLAHNPHKHDCQVHYPEEKGLLSKWLGSWSHKKHNKHQHREFVVHSDADYDREEVKILQFADAIENEYGPLPGVPEIETGPNDAGEILAAGVGGLLGGALTGAALSGGYPGYYPYNYLPLYEPYPYYAYPDYYSPYVYGPSIIIGDRPYGRNYGFGHDWDRRYGRHRRDEDWDDRRRYRREYGYRSDAALTGAALGAAGGLLLGGSLSGALVGGLAGGSVGYLLSDPYSPAYVSPAYIHYPGYYRYFY